MTTLDELKSILEYGGPGQPRDRGRPPNVVEPAEELAGLTKELMHRAQRYLLGSLKLTEIEHLKDDVEHEVVSKAAKKFEEALRNVLKDE